MAFFLYVVLALVAICHADPASDAAAPAPGAVASAGSSSVCVTRNGFFKADASCDSYVECNDYLPTNKVCPDGLHYNADTKWPNYPCGYPMDVPCVGRAAQPAQPTADCPHQYGYFPSPVAAADNCGQYRMCVAGRAFEMVCPTGLAFNPDSGRCDWPDLVPSCKSDQFLGFTCPAAPLDANGKPLDIVLNYKYEGNCYYFFSCEQGRARLLSCDIGMAFDPVQGRCVDADLVQCQVIGEHATLK